MHTVQVSVALAGSSNFVFGFTMWPNGLLFALALLLGGLWLLIQFGADRRRASAFDDRDAMAFDDWYERFYANKHDAPDKTFVRATMNAFGTAFGVVPTRLRPRDRISHELRLQCKLGLDDAWDALDALLANRFDESFEWSREWLTIDDVIRGLARQYEEARTR